MDLRRRLEFLEQRRRPGAAGERLFCGRLFFVSVEDWKRLCNDFDDGTYVAQRGLRMAFAERLKMTNTSKAVKSNVVREHRAMTWKDQDAKRMRDEEK